MGLFNLVKNALSDSDGNKIWVVISDPGQVDNIIKESYKSPQLIYKHSHRCSVCFAAKGNLEAAASDIHQQAVMHFVNVVRNREASNKIASELNIRHESPQAILIDQGEVAWYASHGSITADTLLRQFE